MKNKSEQLLSFAENELMQKESIRRAVLSEAPAKQKTPIAWTKILLPIAACLVLLCGTALLIPSARAEIFSWFHSSGPMDYLSVAPDERASVPVLDELILPPAQTSAPTLIPLEVPVDAVTETPSQITSNTPDDPLIEAPEHAVADAPLGSVTDNHVLLVCEEPIWQQIADSFSIELGETLFDGEALYLGVTYHGLTALPETVRYVGGSATATRESDEDLAELFEDGKVPDVYYKNNVSLWESHEGRFWLRLPNGDEFFLGIANLLSSSPELNREFSQFCESLRQPEGGLTDAEQDAISEAMIAWLDGRTVRGLIRQPVGHQTVGFRNGKDFRIEDSRQYLLDQADENGILHATLLYKAGPSGTYLTAELGTAQFDLRAWEHIDRDNLAAAAESAVCPSQKVILSRLEWIETTYDESTPVVTNAEVDIEGLEFTAENGGYIDGIGIHDIRVDVTLPENWSDEVCQTFCRNFHFLAMIDDACYSLNQSVTKSENGRELSFVLSTLRVPYDRIGTFETVCIVPCLTYITGMQLNDEIIPLELNVPMPVPDTTDNVSWVGAGTELTSGILTFSRRSK